MIKLAIIKKLPNGKGYRLYSRKKDPSGHRRNLGTYDSLESVKKREQEVQYFKQHADDGMADDKESKSLSKMSDIATFLEEAGFIDAADKVYDAMCAVDGSLEQEDNLIDNSMLLPDAQRNLEGGGGAISGLAGGGAPGLFAIDVAERVAMIDLANRLDKLGFYDEANDIDDILKDVDADEDFLNDAEMSSIIGELEEMVNKKENETVEPAPKQEEEAVARSNGLTENSGGTSQFSGLSDSYFYSEYGNLGTQYK